MIKRKNKMNTKNIELIFLNKIIYHYIMASVVSAKYISTQLSKL
jgi:hypothetical protein